MKRATYFLASLVVASALFAGICSAETIVATSYGTSASGTITDYEWWYGCSPTAAGMMMGYYDTFDGGKPFYYPDLVPGAAEANTFPYTSGPYNVNDIIASSGHIDNFYSGAGSAGGIASGAYGVTGDDVSEPWHSFDSLADFMGTSQDAYSNPNGSTTFYTYTSGAKLTDANAVTLGIWQSSGMYGIKEYAEYAGYSATAYNQLIDAMVGSGGFTFADYKAEIDADRPMLLHVDDLNFGNRVGHTMFAYGYEGSDTVLLRDTWTSGLHTMTWGGSYGSSDFGPMQQHSMTGLALSGGVATPEPGTALLALIGLVAAVRVRRRRKRGGGDDS